MIPAIFIPGMLCTGALFDKQRVALDGELKIGIGDITQADSITKMAEQILDRAPDRFLLLGFSMGGVVALEIMRRAGERVRGLALVDTSARTDALWQAALGSVFLGSAEIAGLDWTMRKLIPRLLFEQGQADKAIKAKILEMAQSLGLDVLRRQRSALAKREDYRSSLARIACPTLVIAGADDPLATPKLAQEMASAIRGADVEIIPRCGHFSVLERANEVNAALQRLVSERIASRIG